MVDAVLPGVPELTGEVMLYSKPEPLSKELHGKLGIKQLDNPFIFAVGAHVAPMTVTEFNVAALSFPIIFVGDARQPVAVLGLNAGENLFTNAAGTWDYDAYVPAYIRRYPFVLADDKAEERMIVCIDRTAAMISDKPDAPFFDKDGEPTDITTNAIEFCNNYETERRRTESFVELLTGLDLFEVKEANFEPRNEDGSFGAPQKIADYFAVSEEKLNALAPAKLAELRDNGALQQIYVHLNSLVGWDRLIVKAVNRADKAATPVAANS